MLLGFAPARWLAQFGYPRAALVACVITLALGAALAVGYARRSRSNRTAAERKAVDAVLAKLDDPR
jgi:hypothetical protein